jgi:hypothetical protein
MEGVWQAGSAAAELGGPRQCRHAAVRALGTEGLRGAGRLAEVRDWGLWTWDLRFETQDSHGGAGGKAGVWDSLVGQASRGMMQSTFPIHLDHMAGPPRLLSSKWSSSQQGSTVMRMASSDG